MQWDSQNTDAAWAEKLHKLLKWNKQIVQKPLYKLPNGKL